MTVALMATKVIVVTDEGEEKNVPLQAMIFFRKCPPDKLPEVGINWPDWQAEDLVTEIEADSGPLPPREKQFMMELEELAAEYEDYWTVQVSGQTLNVLFAFLHPNLPEM